MFKIKSHPMKKHLLIILAFLCSGFLFSQSVPNGGFENWNTITYDDPNFYQTSKNIDLALILIERTIIAEGNKN